MSDEVRKGLSGEPERVPSIWKRSTVADGAWLQTYTLNRFSARDVYLADQIDKNIDRIDNLEAANDVINVYGNWGAFTENSGALFTISGITNNDIIKVLNDENSYPNDEFPDADPISAGHQTYFQWVITSTDPSAFVKPLHENDGEWNFIGYLDPYYNKTEIDTIINGISSTIASGYHASGSILSGLNLSSKYTNNEGEPPVIEIGTKDNVIFTGVSSVNFSANLATANNLSSINVSATNFSATKVSANELSATTISSNALSSTKISAYSLSAQTISSLSASGISAVFTGISAQGITSTNFDIDTINAKNITATAISAYQLTANSASGQSANFITGYFKNLTGSSVSAKYITGESARYNGYSGKNISGEQYNSTIDGLITSAENGKHASAVLASAYWSATDLNGQHKASGLLQSSFHISAGENLGLDIVNDNIIRISAAPAGIVTIDAKDTNTNVNTTFPGPNFLLSAGSGIDFVTASNDPNLLNISADAGLMGSANSGQSAYDWITTKSASLKAGSGIKFYSADENQLGICTTGVMFEGDLTAGTDIKINNNVISVDTNGVIANGSGHGNFVAGRDTYISGNDNNVFGYNNRVTGDGNYVGGQGQAYVNGYTNIVHASNVEVFGTYNAVFGGSQQKISGHGNLNAGEGNRAFGNDNLIVGMNNDLSGDTFGHNIVGGNRNKVSSYYVIDSVIIGDTNTIYDNSAQGMSAKNTVRGTYLGGNNNAIIVNSGNASTYYNIIHGCSISSYTNNLEYNAIFGNGNTISAKAFTGNVIGGGGHKLSGEGSYYSNAIFGNQQEISAPGTATVIEYNIFGGSANKINGLVDSNIIVGIGLYAKGSVIAENAIFGVNHDISADAIATNIIAGIGHTMSGGPYPNSTICSNAIFGQSNHFSGSRISNSFVVGTSNTANDITNSNIIGNSNKVTGDCFNIVGSLNSANGAGSVYIIGEVNSANGQNIYVIGEHLTATENQSILIGYQTNKLKMNSYRSTLGFDSCQLYVDAGSANIGTYPANDPNAVFVVGDGTGENSRSNALVVKRYGYVSGRDFRADNVSLSSLKTISAHGRGIAANTTATYNLSAIRLSAGEGVSFVTAQAGILGISGDGATYRAGSHISIGNDKTISVSSNFVSAWGTDKLTMRKVDTLPAPNSMQTGVIYVV